MNDNHKRFNWYVNIHFRSVFKSIFLDVNERPMKYSIGSIGILSILVINQIGCIYAYFNSKRLAVSPIFAIATFIGIIQVSYIPNIDVHQAIFGGFQKIILIKFWFSGHLQIHLHQWLTTPFPTRPFYWRNLCANQLSGNMHQIHEHCGEAS